MQSHFVKLEPPYQIIHYGGVVGIQIGTLIVVGESYPGDYSSLDIFTHSHPVVSYVDKNQLKAKLGKERSGFWVSHWGGGEGNVWSKVEVSDVDVIGLWDVEALFMMALVIWMQRRVPIAKTAFMICTITCEELDWNLMFLPLLLIVQRLVFVCVASNMTTVLSECSYSAVN